MKAKRPATSAGMPTAMPDIIIYLFTILEYKYVYFVSSCSYFVMHTIYLADIL